MFHYDWFHGVAFEQQQGEAICRCLARHFPDVDLDQKENNSEIAAFREELEMRTLIYLRDGFSYEIKELAAVETKSHLVFECEPVDEQYKVGSFVVTVPFEEIVRVEVFAVHPSEKPVDWPQITGFRRGAEPVPPERP
ncbi:MAG: hypothetical protein JSU63_07790 [Phycisphaerales bacterium]|nr:MAG: hypothetical protein JSU63_07790 [Phycisphaerales bacterium]